MKNLTVKGVGRMLVVTGLAAIIPARATGSARGVSATTPGSASTGGRKGTMWTSTGWLVNLVDFPVEIVGAFA